MVTNKSSGERSLVLLVGDLAHLAQACAGTGKVVLELEDFDLEGNVSVAV